MLARAWCYLGLLVVALGGCAAERKSNQPSAPVPGPYTIQVPADEPTIQAALSRARTGDTVLVAPGRYAGDGNHDLDFGGQDIVLIGRGGADSCIVDCGRPNDFHRGFNFHRAETRAAILDGFTITGGSPHRGPEALSGGAIACSLASPIIRRCRIVDNSALTGGGAWLDSSDAVIENCQFLRNVVLGNVVGGWGGGMVIVHGAPLIRNCEFRENYAEATSGGLDCGSTRAVLENLRIVGNGGFRGGGGIGLGNFYGLMSNCEILGNYSEDGPGGAVGISGGAAILQNCRVEGNVSRSGGTVDISYGSTQLIDLTIRGNGPYLTFGGSGIACEFGTVACRRCVLTDNVSGWGGAISSSVHSVFELDQCTIAGNYAGEGGGIVAVGGSVRLARSILSGNFSSDGVDAKIWGDANLKVTDCLADTSRFVVQGGLTLGGLVISEDPRFCSPSSGRQRAPIRLAGPAPTRFGDYRLARNSPGRRPDGAVWGALADSCGQVNNTVGSR